MKRNLCSAFTLTELMTVIIIIAILMGLATGTYHNAVERAAFEEGFADAHTVMAAVEHYHQDFPSVTRPTVTQTQVEFSTQGACKVASNYCVKTKYFEITINDGSVQAKRNNGKYTLTVYPETFGSNRLKFDTCQQTNGKTDFCVSKDYTDCSGSVCRKQV